MPPVVDLFAQALRHFQAGQWQQADPLLRHILLLDPRHGGALHILGTMAFQARRHAEAAEFFEQAAASDPANAVFHSTLGSAYQALGKLAEALQCHERAVRLGPQDVLVLNNLGITLASLGQTERAVAVLRQAAALAPHDPEVLNNLAAALRAHGHLDEAVSLCRQALRLRPDFAEAHLNLGNAMRQQDQLEAALASHQDALRCAPDFAPAYVGLGHTLRVCGKLDQSLLAYRQALQARPGCLEAYLGLGEALLARNQWAEALAAYEQALRVRPDSPEVYVGLGNAYFAQGQVERAESCYRSALELRPSYSEARYNLGLAYQVQGRLPEARACYQEAMRLKPDDPVAHSTYAGSLLYDPEVDSLTLLAEHRRWGELHGRSGPAPPVFANPPDPERRLRVGYVSPDFRSHAVAYFLEPILAHHDPARVESFCYADVGAPDATTARLRARAHRWRETFGLSDDRLARLVAQDGIDLLIDLAGHTAGSRLRAFACRPALVQVSYLGYPATTGVSGVHYRLVDAVTDPPDDPACHTEELVRLPTVFCCYAPPAGAPAVDPSPAGRNGYVTFGSLNKLEKLNPAVLDLWCQLLREVPTARLLLSRHVLQGRVANNLVRQFAERGIEPARLILHSVEARDLRHLQTYAEIDVALDPFPWGGHTTACEALWMGVPVLTLRGQRHSGRMVASILTCVGLRDLIAESPGDYVRAGARLAADRALLADLRSHLRGQVAASPLCDGAAFTRGLEAVYRRLWQRWCAQR